jgi:hypothetical protein
VYQEGANIDHALRFEASNRAHDVGIFLILNQ